MNPGLPIAPRAIAWIDGAARGNPGPAAYGVRIESEDGSLITELRDVVGATTNNVAEYHGLIAALDYLAAHRHRDVVIRSDSELLVRQMTGAYRVRAPSLRALYVKASDAAARFDSVKYEHVPRERNARADRLANVALDGAPWKRPVPAARQEPSADAAGIIGIGIDIEEVARVEDLLNRYRDRFVARIFTDAEAAYCRKRRTPAPHFAARFSAKEAAMKALGTGRARGVLWRDIEVVRHGGPPTLALHGGAQRRFDELGGSGALLTLTHSRRYSVAQVILLGRRPN